MHYTVHNRAEVQHKIAARFEDMRRQTVKTAFVKSASKITAIYRFDLQSLRSSIL